MNGATAKQSGPRSGLWELGKETTTPMSARASPLSWINCQFIHHQKRAEPAVNGPQYFTAAWRSGGCLCMCSSVCCTQFASTECWNTMLLKNVCVQFAVHVDVILPKLFFALDGSTVFHFSIMLYLLEILLLISI